MLLLIFLFVFFCETQTTECLAQQNVKRIINGQVKDTETSEPVGSVNVFLSNTTIGTSTDSTGIFMIPDVPSGVFDLVISRVGYEREIKLVDMVSSESLYYDIKLIPKIIQTTEFEITVDQPTEWKKNLNRFIKVFIGGSEFADECKIHNPEVINFRFFNDTLIAQTDSILHIDNMSLGYRLHIILNEFIWNTDRDYGHYLIYPFFAPLNTRDTKEKTEWEENRQKAYKGSLKHFLHALVHRNTEENMFRIFAGTLDKLMSGYGHRVNPEDFEIEQIEGTPLFSLKFNGFLRVEYGKIIDNEIERGGNYHGVPVWGVRKIDFSSTSIITMRSYCAYIDSLGNLFDPLSIEVSGMWANKRVAELVPMY